VRYRNVRGAKGVKKIRPERTSSSSEKRFKGTETDGLKKLRPEGVIRSEKEEPLGSL